jgi:polyribonucleotide nucleotidyltransferase
MASYWFQPESVSLDVGDRTMTIETGRLAKQAAGAVLVSYGETAVLVTAAHANPRPGIDFFPLVVDFVEKTSAAGKIPGGFFKREGRLSDREVLVSRFIDRSIRPLFAEGYRDETQIIATVVSADGENLPDIPAFVGASAALTLSQLPFLGPISAVRMGRVGGELLVNPTRDQLAESDLELVVAGSRDALVMVEGGARQVSEADVLAALKAAHGEIVRSIDAQEDLRSRVGKPKLEMPEPEDLSELAGGVREQAGARLGEAVRIQTKAERYAAIDAVEREVLEGFVTTYRDEPATLDTLAAVEDRRAGLAKLSGQVKESLHDLRSELMRARILDDGVRIDGRAPTEIRQIACARRVTLHPRRDPGPGLHHPGRRERRADDRFAHGTQEQALLPALQLPALLGGRGAHVARSRAPRSGPRDPGGTRGAGRAPGARGFSVHDPHRLGDPRVQRLVLHGHRVRRFALAHGRGRAHQGAGGRNRHGSHRGGGPRRDPVGHPR